MLSLHTSPLARLGRSRDAGGMNVYVRQLSLELGRSGMLVDVFTRWTDRSEPLVESLGDGVRLIRIQAGPVAPLSTTELAPYTDEFARRVARLACLQGHPYDLVHSHYWLSGVVGMSLAREWDVPHVAMFHTIERLKGERLGTLPQPTSAGAHRAECEGQIAATADCVTVATDHERDQLRRLYGLSAAHLEVIPCGVDLRAFGASSAERRRAARATLGLAPDVPVLLSVCRLDPIKGADLLLESVAAMRTPATVVLVGGDPDGDPELERLGRRAVELGLGERVRLPGAEPQERLPLYYHAADALVVASRYESFGLVAVEALACGTPVVAAHVGGLPSILRDGENGVLVPWRRPEAFAQAIDGLLGDAPRLARMRAAARPSVLRFDWRRIGDQVRGVYQSLSAERREAMACCCM